MSKSNEDSHLLTRREFTAESVMALLAGVTITVSGCGDDDPPTGPSTSSDVSGSVSANHGHTVTLTAAQITSATGVTLSLVGSGTHTHTVQLTAAQVQQAGARQRVVVTSTTDSGHSHDVTFN